VNWRERKRSEWMKRLKKAKSLFVYRNPEEEGHVLGDKARLTEALRLSFVSVKVVCVTRSF
jgi:hypothetical protein